MDHFERGHDTGVEEQKTGVELAMVGISENLLDVLRVDVADVVVQERAELAREKVEVVFFKMFINILDGVGELVKDP